MNLQPIIVIGMHRSGTTLVTDLLDALGVFRGALLDNNSEAIFFQNLNEWLLRQCGGSWDNPEVIRHLLGSDEARARAVTILRDLLSSPRVLFYLGPGLLLRNQSLFSMRQAWCWKDPRNTFTLPLWLDLFPEARIIHVARHGVDVAASLRNRALKSFRRSDPIWVSLQRRFMPRPQRFAQSLACLDLLEGLRLWDSYLCEAEAHLAQLGQRAMRVCYEDLLRDPLPVFTQIASFLGQSPSHERLMPLAKTIRSDRCFAFVSDPELRSFARDHESLLKRHGYSALASL